MGYDTLFAGTYLKGFETEDMSLHLYERHVAVQFADTVQAAPIYMFVGEILQQVAKRVDAQFVAEHLTPVGTHARQVLDVLLEQGNHAVSTSAIFKS